MNKLKKIAIIGTNGLPGRYGGWDQLMEHLTKMLSIKYNFIVYCQSPKDKVKLSHYNGAKLVYLPLKANGWQSILYDILSSIHAIFYADTILLLGGAGTLMFPILRLFNKEVIYHMAGIEWKRKKFSFFTQTFLLMLEKVGVYFSNKIISDNDEISNYLLKKYHKTSFLIEYGADHVLSKELTKHVKDKYDIEKSSYAFKVCRIEPENNIDIILESFINSNVKLIIVGNWNNSKYGINLLRQYSIYSNIILLNPIYDQQKLDILRSNCGIYIHGHSVGCTNPSLVEAMYLGLNVLAYDVSFNRSTSHHSAKYFKDDTELKQYVNEFYHDRTIFNQIGINLKVIALNRYIWEKIVNKYDKLFFND